MKKVLVVFLALFSINLFAVSAPSNVRMNIEGSNKKDIKVTYSAKHASPESIDGIEFKRISYRFNQYDDLSRCESGWYYDNTPVSTSSYITWWGVSYYSTTADSSRVNMDALCDWGTTYGNACGAQFLNKGIKIRARAYTVNWVYNGFTFVPHYEYSSAVYSPTYKITPWNYWDTTNDVNNYCMSFEELDAVPLP